MSDPFHRVVQFKAHLRLEILDTERAFVLGEHEQFMLTGRSQVLVASKLDGRRSVQDVLSALEAEVSAPEVLYALALLEKQGHIVEATPGLRQETAAFWQALGEVPSEAVSRLANSAVAVHALDGLEPRPLVEALRGAGLTVREGAPLHVVLVRDYLTPQLEAFNQEALKRREPWLLVKPSGTTPWVGPVFRPGEGPCWACLAQRLRWNRPVEAFLRGRMGAERSFSLPQAELPASLQTGLHLAAVALARWLAAGRQGSLGSSLLALELSRFQLTEHPVVRRPQCPACGDPGLLKARAEQPVVLEPRPRGFTEDNGFRTVPPETTFARLQSQISPITGVLSSLVPLESRSHALRPVFGASYFCPVHARSPAFTEFHSITLGKGRTPAQARASALGEGIERWSSMFQGDEPRSLARISDLGQDAFHPKELLHFSEAQYRDREAHNNSFQRKF
ncbi:TOMM precursor leader peptide-binding protein, partial [Hyalangium sp.]|uniref:TOMM precursor leader peptide-binding protein n=1 Tax=Hyalangium sp. TaxID=2028555 RepID=UPI002D4054F5